MKLWGQSRDSTSETLVYDQLTEDSQGTALVKHLHMINSQKTVKHFAVILITFSRHHWHDKGHNNNNYYIYSACM